MGTRRFRAPRSREGGPQQRARGACAHCVAGGGDGARTRQVPCCVEACCAVQRAAFGMQYGMWYSMLYGHVGCRPGGLA